MTTDHPVGTPVIKHNGDEKYIIILKTTFHPDTKAPVSREYVLVSLAKRYHSQVAAKYQKSFLDQHSSIQVLGGGIITIDSTHKKVKTYGTSAGYGPPDQDLLVRVVNHSFPDWEKEITITSYIRA